MSDATGSANIRGRRYGLGIDTGGTYTDAAVVDLGTKEVASKAKSPTTYHDLSIGMLAAVDAAMTGAKVGAEEIGLVGLSTTLATNSVLEGRGGKVGLIGIGWRPEEDWHLGADKARFISGGHDARGRQMAPLVLEEAESAIEEVSKGTDAVAVSAFFSVVNPAHEDEVRRLVRERTDLPAVGGRELTTLLGIRERSVTAVMNARLMPIVSGFLGGLEEAMRSRGFRAEMMVFKGDGTLTSLAKAREYPVETILSGPAASLTGGQALARIDECFVIDMGGTSTDIAILDKGQPRLESEGAMIGGWRTRVRAIDIWTAGLGGDSRVWIDLDGIRVGPSRVLPLAEACVHYPGLLAKMRSEGRVEHLVALSRDPKGLGEGERAVFDLVAAEGPISEDELVERLPDVYLARDYVKRLIERTHLLGTGMTPTDALHVTGSYLHGDREGSQFGAEMLGSMIGMTAEELARAVIESTSRRVAEEVAKKAILDASGEVPAGVLGEYVLGQVTGAERGGEMVLCSTLDRPIIGIGAPAEAFLPETARMLGARIVVPPHHDVGNAVGAVCSVVADEVVVEIHHRDLKFQVYAPGKEPVEFMHAEEAVLEAKERAERIARERVEDAGGVEVRVAVEVKVIRCRAGIRNVRELVNWVEVHARATGKPACASSLTKG